MYGSKQLSNVALFPLCDARGVLINALCDTSDAPATREDALVFAWRLELPEGMNVAHAANALLVVAMSVPRKAWTRRQLLIVRELMVLAGREDALPSATRKSSVKKVKTSLAASLQQHRRVTVDRHSPSSLCDSSTAHTKVPQAKESKQWWKLVGRDEADSNREQRKTRAERVSREP